MGMFDFVCASNSFVFHALADHNEKLATMPEENVFFSLLDVWKATMT